MKESSLVARLRRQDLAERDLCINGSKHGPPTHGRRCAWCHSVHRNGLLATVKAHEATGSPKRPPGHKIVARGQ